MSVERLITRLRGLHRGYKFAVLLIAAWAPFLLPGHPFLTWGLMALMSGLFIVVTGYSRTAVVVDSLVGHEKADVEL